MRADDNVKWSCYVCDPKPLASLIDASSKVMDAIARIDRKERERDIKRIAKITQISLPDLEPLASSTPTSSSAGTATLKPRSSNIFVRRQPSSLHVTAKLLHSNTATGPTAVVVKKDTDKEAGIEVVENDKNMRLFCQWANLNLNEKNIKPVNILAVISSQYSYRSVVPNLWVI